MGRPPSRKGTKVSDLQKSYLDAGRAKAHANNRARKASGVKLPDAREKLAMLLSGELSYKELTDEELDRMQLRNKSGTFTGSYNILLPSEVTRAMRQELLRRSQGKLDGALQRAIKRLVTLVDDPDVDPKDQIRAIAIILERALGRVPETVNINQTATVWQTMDDVEIDRDEDDIVDGEVLETMEIEP